MKNRQITLQHDFPEEESMKRPQIAIIVLLLAAMLLAACGGSAPTPQVVEKSMAPAPAEAPAAESVDTDATLSNGAPASEIIQETRKIIYNANMTLIVDDTESAAQEIADMAAGMGGYVANMNGYRQGDRMIYDVTIRIPSEKFEAGRSALRSMAVRVENEQVNTDDVTDQYFDIDARLRTLKATEEELTQLLKETRERGGKVEDIMKIYDRLIQIRSQIESLQGKLNRLDKLTAFSTISIHLEPYILSKPIESQGWRPAEIIHSSFESLVDVLTGLATLLIQFIIVVVPILLILLLPLALIIWLVHRWQKRRQSKEEMDTSG